MPTLSIIKSGHKCAVTYAGDETEITRMLTQCALRDELLAEAVLQSALCIIQRRMGTANQQNLGLHTDTIQL